MYLDWMYLTMYVPTVCVGGWVEYISTTVRSRSCIMHADADAGIHTEGRWWVGRLRVGGLGCKRWMVAW